MLIKQLFEENNCRLCRKTFCCPSCRLLHEYGSHHIHPECELCLYGVAKLDKLVNWATCGGGNVASNADRDNTDSRDPLATLLAHMIDAHTQQIRCLYCSRLFTTEKELLQNRRCVILLFTHPAHNSGHARRMEMYNRATGGSCLQTATSTTPVILNYDNSPNQVQQQYMKIPDCPIEPFCFSTPLHRNGEQFLRDNEHITPVECEELFSQKQLEEKKRTMYTTPNDGHGDSATKADTDGENDTSTAPSAQPSGEDRPHRQQKNRRRVTFSNTPLMEGSARMQSRDGNLLLRSSLKKREKLCDDIKLGESPKCPPKLKSKNNGGLQDHQPKQIVLEIQDKVANEVNDQKSRIEDVSMSNETLWESAINESQFNTSDLPNLAVKKEQSEEIIKTEQLGEDISGCIDAAASTNDLMLSEGESQDYQTGRTNLEYSTDSSMCVSQSIQVSTCTDIECDRIEDRSSGNGLWSSVAYIWRNVVGRAVKNPIGLKRFYSETDASELNEPVQERKKRRLSLHCRRPIHHYPKPRNLDICRNIKKVNRGMQTN